MKLCTPSTNFFQSYTLTTAKCSYNEIPVCGEISSWERIADQWHNISMTIYGKLNSMTENSMD